jgi:hypothetical protein
VRVAEDRFGSTPVIENPEPNFRKGCSMPQGRVRPAPHGTIHEHGRMNWQKASGYGRSKVEAAIGRYVCEVKIAVKALNRML